MHTTGETRVARKTADRKRRTRAQVIADLAVNHLERQALLASCTLERIVHDYGLDLILFAYDEQGWNEPGQILIQVKATETVQRLKNSRAISFRVDRRDLNSWMQEHAPVILIVYEATTKRAWWQHIQGSLAGASVIAAGSKQTVTLRIPIKQVVTAKSVQRFARIRQMLLPPRFRLVLPYET